MLSTIYEEEFLSFSYGFRPKRSQHDALDALVVGITSTKVNWILEVDVRSFFDEVSQSWLMRFLEHRIADPRILHLIQRWLKAGILEDGVVTVSEKGTGQGSVISPLLANLFLHYAFDLWAERWRRREATFDMIMCATRTMVCHERTYERRCGAVQEMEVGPPEPAVRGRLQTTASCDGQEPWW